MDIQEKEAFKAWFKKEYLGIDNLANQGDEGAITRRDYAYVGWQAAKAQAVPECTWSQNEDGYFDTSCRQSFVFTEPEDRPYDHQFTHCCFCGGKLIESQEPTQP